MQSDIPILCLSRKREAMSAPPPQAFAGGRVEHCHGCEGCGPDARKADASWRNSLQLGDLWDG